MTVPFPFPEGEEYEVVPTRTLDPFAHSEQYPFCIDTTCPCHEDQEAIGVVNAQYQDGLVTAGEATRIVQGRGIRWGKERP